MVLKDPKSSTLSRLILGGDLTLKHTVIRILYSVICGIGCPLVINSLVSELPRYFYQFAIPIITLVTYFIGYPWVVLSFIKEELDDKRPSDSN